MKSELIRRLKSGESFFAHPNRKYNHYHNLRKVLFEVTVDSSGRLVFYEWYDGIRVNRRSVEWVRQYFIDNKRICDRPFMRRENEEFTELLRKSKKN